MADVNFKRNWLPFVHDGIAYQLSHLDEQIVEYPIANEDPVTIVILYAHHCFARARRAGDAEALEYTLWHTDPRTFCFRRHALSLGLPEIVMAAMHQKVGMNSHREHYFKVTATELDGQLVEYAFAFTLDRERGRLLTMRVRSAYPLDEENPKAEQGKVKFSQLVKFRLRGEHPKRIFR